ncbi:reverse transcriptase [compost metagenome]
MERALIRVTEEGTPQGGPLSPLLSTIVLDGLDKELEKRNLRFVRHADGCNIYVKTWKAGQRVMNSVRGFIERKLRLRLKVNQAKSAVDRPWKCISIGDRCRKARIGPKGANENKWGVEFSFTGLHYDFKSGKFFSEVPCKVRY